MRYATLHGQTARGWPIRIRCRDGVDLKGHLWRASGARAAGSIIINPATGVLARYYHRYARFLAEHGFDVLTYDYRGIGLSRPERLKHCGYRWRDWGEHDFESALRVMRNESRANRLIVVGHSIGGFLPGLAENAHCIDRMLTIGAQYAWWGDYAARQRVTLFLKWHVVMPVLTAMYGFFPGRRLGWLEDLPAGVANEWSFRGPRFETSFPVHKQPVVLDRMATVTAPILAVAVTDDEFGTVPAIRRTLGYYAGAEKTAVLLRPRDCDRESIGHFGLFHDSHAAGFWLDALLWLRDGRNPWPDRVVQS